jgi:SAM-dependent methyltransferase
MSLKTAARKSVILKCLYFLCTDLLAGWRLAIGHTDTLSGRRHAGLDVDQSLTYIERLHTDYLAYAEVSAIEGKVCEIGPGDNFGLAVTLLSHGASEVHAIDRFRSQRDPVSQRRIYAALAQKLAPTEPFDGPPDETTIRGFHYHANQPAESYFRDAGLTFDAVVSRAVLEHLYDPISALDDMYASLAPGGRLIHRIDLRDHGMFAGHHPLTFLTIADSFYRWMVRYTGRPNRVRLDSYCEWHAASGAGGGLAITRLAGIESEFPALSWDELPRSSREQAMAAAAVIRPRLASRFKHIDDRDLAVAGCVLVACKPK